MVLGELLELLLIVIFDLLALVSELGLLPGLLGEEGLELRVLLLVELRLRVELLFERLRLVRVDLHDLVVHVVDLKVPALEFLDLEVFLMQVVLGVLDDNFNCVLEAPLFLPELNNGLFEHEDLLPLFKLLLWVLRGLLARAVLRESFTLAVRHLRLALLAHLAGRIWVINIKRRFCELRYADVKY